MFKNLIGKGHPDFSTKNQQDAHEFFLHLLTNVQVFCVICTLGKTLNLILQLFLI